MEIEVEKVMSREKLANSLHTIIDKGVDLLGKKSFDQEDYTKLRVLRNLGIHVSAAVTMVQLEVAQQKASIILERMKQLGYNTPKKLA